MSLDEIMAINISGLNVLVVGLAASGKSFLAGKMYAKNPSHILIGCDNYMGFEYKDALYHILEDLGDPHKHGFNPFIVEGVQGYRILRKGLEIPCWKPDITIVCETSTKRRHEIYRQERDPKKLEYMQKFDLNLMGIWTEYLKKASKEDLKKIFYFENYH